MSREDSKLDANNNWDYAFNMTNNNSEANSGTGTNDAYNTANGINSGVRIHNTSYQDTYQVVRVSDDSVSC